MVKLTEILRAARREPLVHFLLAGAAIFLLFGWIGTPVDAGSRQITISESQVNRLVTSWQSTWRRPPSPQELDGLIRDYIKEEVYYREALRLELDKDDPVIRRRLRSKMEFLATSAANEDLPDDGDLQAWLDSHKNRYAAPPKYNFAQIYINGQAGTGAAEARAITILRSLSSGKDPSQLGDAISLPPTMSDASAEDIAKTFGDDFSVALAKQPATRWVGPISSGFGLHLVRISKVSLATAPKLSEVRQAVENDWRSDNKSKREAKAYQALLDGYDIKIERR